MRKEEEKILWEIQNINKRMDRCEKEILKTDGAKFMREIKVLEKKKDKWMEILFDYYKKLKTGKWKE